jgi:hypothetical protein
MTVPNLFSFVFQFDGDVMNEWSKEHDYLIKYYSNIYKLRLDLNLQPPEHYCYDNVIVLQNC